MAARILRASAHASPAAWCFATASITRAVEGTSSACLGCAPSCERRASSSVAAAAGAGPHMAIILERLPVLIREEEQWSRDFRTFVARRQDQTGHRIPDDVRSYFRLPANFERQGAELERLRSMPKMPRVTGADESGDVRSLNRRLEERLFFVATGVSSYNTKDAGRGLGFPSLRWDETSDLTGRGLAAQALQEAGLQTTRDFEIYHMGNPPASHVVNELDGNMFFFRSQLVAGTVTGVAPGGRPGDFAWLSLDELLQELPEGWRDTVNTMLRR